MADFSSSGAMVSSFSSSSVSTMATGGEVHMHRDLLQGTTPVHFEKTLTPSNVSDGVPNSRCSLEIPQWFVERHGNQVEEYVILRCGTSAQPRAPWVVRISPFPLVRMSCGWKRFAAFNGLREGHLVLFCLRAVSEFEVFVVAPGTGSPQQQPPSVVDTLCGRMGKLSTLEAQNAGTVVAASLPSLSCIPNFHPGFPVENVRVSSLRNSRSPTEHPERTVSFSGIDTVYYAHTTGDHPSHSSRVNNQDQSHIRSFLLRF